MQGKTGIYPTESCQEVDLLGVYRVICLIGAMIVWWAQMEVDAVCPENILEGLGELIVNAEGGGF